MIHADLTQWPCMNPVAIVTTRATTDKNNPQGFANYK